MSTTPTTSRPIVVYNLSPKPAVAVTEAPAVITLMTGNVHFPTAAASLATATTNLAALGKAIGDVKNKVPGAVAVRKNAMRDVKIAFTALKAIVQSAADADAVNAEAIILSAGMKVRKVVVRKKSEFAATWGDISGMVLLVAKAIASRASYQWQWSLDGKTWNTLPNTLQAKTAVHGLAPATTYLFRFKATIKGGEQDWSQTVSLLVK